MKNRLAGWSAAVLLLTWTAAASGGVTMSVVTAGGSGTSVTIAPGGTFSVDMRLDIQDIVVTAAQAQLAAGTANVLDITSGTYNTTDWSASLGLPINPMGLDPVGPDPIGSLPIGDSIGPTIVTVLATVHLTVDAAAPAGTYTLNVTAIAVGDDTYTDVDANAGPDFIITVSSSSTPGDGGTTPPDDGGTEPPDDGGTEPPDDGGTAGPGDDQTPPDDGNTAIPVVARCGAGMVESLALSLTALLLLPRRRCR